MLGDRGAAVLNRAGSGACGCGAMAAQGSEWWWVFCDHTPYCAAHMLPGWSSVCPECRQVWSPRPSHASTYMKST